MKLSVVDRIIISALYPKESDLVTQVLVQDIIKKVAFTQEEFTAMGFKIDGQTYSWDQSKAIEKDVDLTDTEHNFLKTQINVLDREKKVSQQMLPLINKFNDKSFIRGI